MSNLVLIPSHASSEKLRDILGRSNLGTRWVAGGAATGATGAAGVGACTVRWICIKVCAKASLTSRVT